jgi:hypothetical protein
MQLLVLLLLLLLQLRRQCGDDGGGGDRSESTRIMMYDKNDGEGILLFNHSQKGSNHYPRLFSRFILLHYNT